MAKKLYDVMCRDLAKYFLQDVAGANDIDEQELAEAIQELCEGFCSELEEND